MAEERNPLTPAEQARTTPQGTTPASTGTYAAREKEPQDIERDIDHTRAEMSETLDAIGARFQPDYIKEQAKDAIRSTARDAGTTMLDTIKENPVPSIIAGLSIGWLVAKGGESDRDRYYRERYDEDHYRRYGRYPEYANTQRYGTYRSGYASGYAEEDQRSVKDRAGDVADQAKQKAGQATDQLHEFADDARDYGRRAENWLERQMNESPLMMGALSLAAGALVGLAVPETRMEDEWLGAKSDRVKEQARDMAEEKLDQAKRVAEATADEAKDKAKDVAETAKQEAKKQNLDEPPSMKKTGGKSGVSVSTSSDGPSASVSSGSTRVGSTGGGSKS